MANDLRLGMIGLDSTHSVEFTRRFQSQDCPLIQRVSGARVTRCMRFETPFQGPAGLDERQAQLERLDVLVTDDLETAISDIDALMILINDPTLHLPYLQRCSELSVPIFIDKPLAENIDSAKKIYSIINKYGLRICSTSSLRFAPELQQACEAIPIPQHVNVHGILSRASAGSSLIWYGVHAIEMLVSSIGRGASTVSTHTCGEHAIIVLDYSDGRTGVVELYTGNGVYGGVLRSDLQVAPYTVDFSGVYSAMLTAIMPFLNGKNSPVPIEDTDEVMAILDAAERSAQTGSAATIRIRP